MSTDIETICLRGCFFSFSFSGDIIVRLIFTFISHSWMIHDTGTYYNTFAVKSGRNQNFTPSDAWIPSVTSYDSLCDASRESNCVDEQKWLILVCAPSNPKSKLSSTRVHTAYTRLNQPTKLSSNHSNESYEFSSFAMCCCCCYHDRMYVCGIAIVPFLIIINFLIAIYKIIKGASVASPFLMQ